MISEVATGTATIPESDPGEPVVLVIPITPAMSTDSYTSFVLRPAGLPFEDVEVTGQTETEVEITVTRPQGFAGSPGITFHVLCVQAVDIDSGWVGLEFADGVTLDAGWAPTGGFVHFRKVNSIVYCQFEVIAGAGIDGTAKTTSVRLLDFDGIDETWLPSLNNSPIGTALDESDQVMVLAVSGDDIYVQGPAGTTGTWADGVSYIAGLVSWVV